MEFKTVEQYKEALKDIIKVQCSDGNWNYDPYMQGMANGLLCAMSVLTSEDVEYLSAPAKWLKDKPSLESPTLAEPEGIAPVTTEIMKGLLASEGVNDYEGCMKWAYGKEWSVTTPKRMGEIYQMRFGDLPDNKTRIQVIAEKWKGLWCD